jgi:hypothetical protein
MSGLKIDARIAWVGVTGQGQIRVQAQKQHLDP